MRRVLWITLLLNLAGERGQDRGGQALGQPGHGGRRLPQPGGRRQQRHRPGRGRLRLRASRPRAIPTATASSRPRPPWSSAAPSSCLAYQVVSGAFAPRGRTRAPPAIGWLNWAVMVATLGMNLFVSWLRGARGPPPGQRLPARRRRPHALRPLRVARGHRLLRRGPGGPAPGRRGGGRAHRRASSPSRPCRSCCAPSTS